MTLHRTLASLLAAAATLWWAPVTAQLDEFQGFGSPDEPAIDLSAPEIQPVASDWLLMITANLQSDALASSDAPDTRQQDFELRRARISALLDYRARWSLRAGIDVADGVDLREAAVQYQGTRWGVEFGRVVEPFGLLQASTRGATFAERPLALALAPGYGVGTTVTAAWPAVGFAFGLYEATGNEIFFGGRRERALTGRLHWAPVNRPESTLHVGFSQSLRVGEGDQIRFVAIPETLMLNGYNINSATFSELGYHLSGFELALRAGPLLLRSEYLNADVYDFQLDGANTRFEKPSFDGRYVELAYTLTGEQREYGHRQGIFSSLTPSAPISVGGLGALELAVRHSQVDFSNPDAGGERGEVRSVGLNWYASPDLKLSLQYLQLEEQGPNESETADALQLRLQWLFVWI